MTRFRRFCLLCVLFLPLAACWIGPPVRDRAEEGKLFVYLEPFSVEAGRIAFSLDSISAEQEDGTLVPLELRKREYPGTDLTRQRLIATGSLRPGRYRGLSLKVGEAVLKTEEGDAALLIPEQAVRKHAPFLAERDGKIVFSLRFNVRDSLSGGYRFSPAFQIFRPERPLVGLTGLATDQESGAVVVFDKKWMSVTGAISVGSGPKGMVLDPLSNRAYAALPDDDSVAIVDIASGDLVDRISLLHGDRPRDVALSPDGKVLITVNEGSNSVGFIDARSGVELHRLGVGEGPLAITVDRTGRRAYVFSSLSNSISIIDIPDLGKAKCSSDPAQCASLVAVVQTDAGPFSGEFNRKGDRLYVLHENSPYMNVIDPFSFSALKRVYVGTQARALKVDTNTDMVYVAGTGGAGVEVFDPFSLLPVETIAAGTMTDFMTIDNELNLLLLLSSRAGTMTAVHLTTRKTVSAIDVGLRPYRVRVIGER